MNDDVNDASITQVELLKARLQLAWNWFEYHARQRMTMFYNFLIITGILLNGYALAQKEKFYWVSWGVSMLGLLQAIGFWLIDVRNRQLIAYAEEILEKIERDYLFPDGFGLTKPGGVKLGLHRRDPLGEGKKFQSQRLLKMKYPMRTMYASVLLVFLVTLVDSSCRIFKGHALWPIW